MSVLFITFFAGGLFLLQRTLYQRFWNKGVSVNITFEKEEVTEGEENTLLEILENRKWLPLSALKVKFQCSRHLKFREGKGSVETDLYYRSDFFSVMPYQRITRTLKLQCPKRGYYSIYGIDLVAADLFFSQELHDHFDAGAAFYVYPKTFYSRQLNYAMQKITGEAVVRRHVMEDPFTFRGIREYETFDEMKTINWKATARTGNLKVNMRDNTSVKAVRIFLNLADDNILRREELLEMSIRICARMVQEFIHRGIRTSVYANAADALTGQLLSMENNTGQGNLVNIYRALARLNLEKTEKFEDCLGEKLLSDSGMYTVVISPDKHADFQGVLLKMLKEDNFSWLCPVKDMDEDSVLPQLRKNCSMILEEEK